MIDVNFQVYKTWDNVVFLRADGTEAVGKIESWSAIGGFKDGTALIAYRVEPLYGNRNIDVQADRVLRLATKEEATLVIQEK